MSFKQLTSSPIEYSLSTRMTISTDGARVLLLDVDDTLAQSARIGREVVFV